MHVVEAQIDERRRLDLEVGRVLIAVDLRDAALPDAARCRRFRGHRLIPPRVTPSFDARLSRREMREIP
jgi:hypothetical protein